MRSTNYCLGRTILIIDWDKWISIFRLSQWLVTFGRRLPVTSLFACGAISRRDGFKFCGMGADKNFNLRGTPICMWCEQAVIGWARRVISCCHSAKLCAIAAGVLQMQQSGAVWPGCEGIASRKLHKKEPTVNAVCCRMEVILLRPIGWRV